MDNFLLEIPDLPSKPILLQYNKKHHQKAKPLADYSRFQESPRGGCFA